MLKSYQVVTHEEIPEYVVAVAVLLVAVAAAFDLWADALKIHRGKHRQDIEFTGVPRATEAHDTQPGEYEDKDVGMHRGHYRSSGRRGGGCGASAAELEPIVG
jgi:hypothetical protein